MIASGCGSGDLTTRGHGAEEPLPAVAHAINLTPADIPKAKVLGDEWPGEPTGCHDAAEPRETQFHSPAFDLGYELDLALHPPPRQLVISAVARAGSEAAAKRATLYYKTPAGRRCVVREEEDDATASGPLVSRRTSVAPSPLKPPQPGFALRTLHTQTFRSAERHAPRLGEIGDRGGTIATDFIGFAVGRLRVTLIDRHRPGRAPLAFERQLVALLYARAKAHAARRP